MRYSNFLIDSYVCGCRTGHFLMIITQEAVSEIACGHGTGNNFITSHGLTVYKSIELNMCEPVSAYAPLVLPAIISQLCLSTTSLLIPSTVAVPPLLVVVLPSFHLHQYNHSNTVVICSN